MTTSDFLFIGGGIIGISIARELRRRFSDQSVTVIEKETACGLHASGRNSGVIHAGFYYTADSLKARFTRMGNQALRAYCAEKDIPVLACGKLVVARDADDLPRLDELLRRGAVNGVPLQSITAEEAKAIEPRVKTFERAIFSPTTASADPGRLITSLRSDATNEGIVFVTGCAFRKSTNGRVGTSQAQISCGHVVNAAGLYADKIARDFGFSHRYRILPFKGLYLYSD